MLGTVVKKIFGTKQDRDLKKLYPIIQKINALEPQLEKLTDEELKQQTPKLRERLQNGISLDELLPEAFATVREASKRVLKMRHFDVQLIGGIVLHQGRIAEMKTGEGKTLTATLSLYLNALSGKGAHLITVNDYLAQRDAEEMGVLFQWLGLTVGVITNEIDDENRKKAYQADITYGTNNEFAFDYLRDNMKFDISHYVQRKFNFCIVDEVDSILIDEARTPLLISGPSEGNTELYYQIDKIIPKLSKETHYTVDEKHHSVVLTDEGVNKVQEILRIENLFDPVHIETLHHLNQSLKAHNLFIRDVNYVVSEDQKVIIVDEFTGRLKHGSRWSDGLHQAVEAKEGVPIKKENQTLASITFQNFFKLYKKLSGMTGTADTEAEEFGKIYNLDVVVVPTNKPMIREDIADVVYATKAGKYKAVAKTIQQAHQRGQPVLVGTISIDSSEVLSKYLKQMNIAHEVLNAKQHEREASIIANAGQEGAVTIATNMAGRGTDIKLSEKTRQAGGLFIIGTERHESRRIDNQLRGRSGRQGDPGRSEFYLSLEDDLMRVFGSDRIKGLMGRLGMSDDEPIQHKMITNAIAKAQKKVEAHNFDIRKHLLDYDNVMNEQRKVMYRLRKDILDDQGNEELIDQFLEDIAMEIESQSTPERKVSLADWDWEAINQTFQQLTGSEQTLNLNECTDQFQSDLSVYIATRFKSLIKEKFDQYDQQIVKMSIREILLSNFDSCWKDHLLAMDSLREGVGLRSYGQKDPLVEYKRDSFQLFNTMKENIKRNVVSTLFKVRLYTQDEIDEIKRQQQALMEAQMRAHHQQQEMMKKRAEQKNRQKQSGNDASRGPVSGPMPIQRQMPKVGRNDPCPCGSGKKFKQCHGS